MRSITSQIKDRTNLLITFVGSALWILLISMGLRGPADPDMGWHLQNGNYIIQHLRLPMGDVFSWTMPNYPWVSHEWLSDVLMASIYKVGGLTGLVIFFGIIVALIIWTTSRIIKTSWFVQLAVAAVTLFISWSVIGVRPQMFTLLGTALVLLVLFRWRDNPKTNLIWWLPVIFWVWANLHGGFLSGAVVAITFLFGELFRHILLGRARKPKEMAPLLSYLNIRQLIVIGAVSFITTLLTPNLWRSYLELYNTLSDTKVLGQIAEWLHVTLSQPSSYNAAILGLWLLVLLWWNKWRFDTTKLLLAVIMLGFAIDAWRHLPLFAIAAAPLLAEQLSILLEHWKISEWPWAWTAPVVLILIGFNVNQQYRTIVPVLNNPIVYANQYGFPLGAVRYLEQHPPTRLFNEYNWGGYLIWQMPQYKVFIDGRMAIWKDDQTKIFDEFQKILSPDAEIAKAALDKWQIKTLLINVSRPLNLQLESDPAWRSEYRDAFSVVWSRV